MTKRVFTESRYPFLHVKFTTGITLGITFNCSITDFKQVDIPITPAMIEEIENVVSVIAAMEEVLEELHPGAYNIHTNILNLRGELLKESDRGLCLLAVGRVEILMNELLEKTLIGSKTFKRELFNNNGPLSTLSAKVKIAYSIGLISRNEFHQIDTLRTIRNKFAHSDQPINFESVEIAKSCESLALFSFNPDRSLRSRFISSFLFTVSGLATKVTLSNPIKQPVEQLTKESIAKFKDAQNEVLGGLTKIIKNNE